MPRVRLAVIALLVVLAGCTGVPGDATTTDDPGAGPTTELTTEPTTELTTESTTDTTTVDGTEPHTAQGTSHIDTHLVVDPQTGVDNVTVTLGTGGNAETHPVEVGYLDLTREIHERGHGVQVVVERGNETVFNQTVYGYQYYRVTVSETDTSVTQTVV
jgi:hypothetical protein